MTKHVSASLNKIALIGGGPSALFLLKKLVESRINCCLHIFESNAALGKGMPYSNEGALAEHVTNVSSDELTPIYQTLEEWLRLQDQAILDKYEIKKNSVHEKRVIPRLLFGEYLQDQFTKLIEKAESRGIEVNVHLNARVRDILPSDEESSYTVMADNAVVRGINALVICTGHVWSKIEEGNVAGYYDSPYPPKKLDKHFNHAVALKGSSLTAIDAIRTLSVANGKFSRTKEGRLEYEVSRVTPNFKLIMFSLDGLLPNVRFHLDDPLVTSEGMLTDEQLATHRNENQGFVSLDYLFEHNFKSILERDDPNLFKTISQMNLEAFVEWILNSRKAFDPFTLLKIEYIQADRSIKDEHTIQWKKLLALLSYTINHPAKYFSAEDMMRLHNVLQPLIAPMIANVPQSSVEQLIALHNSGTLNLVSVNQNSRVSIEGNNSFVYEFECDNNRTETLEFKTFIDCTGQKPFPIDEFPFKSLFKKHTAMTAMVKFRDKHVAQEHTSAGEKNIVKGVNNDYYLKLKGFAINDFYQLVRADGTVNASCFMMAVPFISGFNPDYSGFDFCDQVSSLIVDEFTRNITESKTYDLVDY